MRSWRLCGVPGECGTCGLHGNGSDAWSRLPVKAPRQDASCYRSATPERAAHVPAASRGVPRPRAARGTFLGHQLHTQLPESSAAHHLSELLHDPVGHRCSLPEVWISVWEEPDSGISAATERSAPSICGSWLSRALTPPRGEPLSQLVTLYIKPSWCRCCAILAPERTLTDTELYQAWS